MISAIFQPEVTVLEDKVSQFQAQVAAAQQRINLLTEAEAIALHLATSTVFVSN